MFNFLDEFIDIFVGRDDTIVLGNNGKWIGRKWINELPTKNMKETLRLLFRNKSRFAIYSQYKESNKWRCKFVALDIDLHGDFDNKEKKLNEISDKIDDLLSHSKKFFFCDKSYIIKERTQNGFHLYIPLKPINNKYPNQDDVLYYISMIRDKITMFFKDILPNDIEFFPKGKVVGDPEENFGAAIRFHLNGEWIWRINKLNKLNIKSIINRAKRINYPSNITQQSQQIKFDNREYKSRNIDDIPDILQRYCDLIDAKKCIVNAIKAEGYDLRGDNGNKMRVRIVQELSNLGVPIEDIVRVYENQSDFNYSKSKYHVEQCIKNNYPYPSCGSIKATGYCDPTCWMLKTSTSSRLTKKEEREPIPNPLHGWDELFEKIGELIKSGKRYFIRKTTRSGTTTATILEAIKQKKKMLMIAPTKKIYDDTLQKAIMKYGLRLGITPPFPRTYKISSNAEICPRIKRRVIEDDILEVFPFLLKPSCSECNEHCPYMNFKQNMEDYEIIFLSTQKLRVLIDNAQSSEEAWYFLNDIIDWCDFVFIDECYNLFEVNFFSIPIIEDKGYSHSNKNEFLTAINSFEQWNGGASVFTEKLKEFVEKIYEAYNSKKEYNFIIKIIDDTINSFLDENKNWVSTFHNFYQFYNDSKNRNIKYLINFFIGLSYSSIYLQKRRKWNGVEVAELICINSIERFMSFLNNLRKPIIMTDAVYPPVDLNKIFRNLEEININDPMRTAKKQTVIVVEKSDPFYKGYSENEDLAAFLEKYGEGENFLVAQSKRYNKYTEKIINDKGININISEQTYHRSDKTIGVESDLRRMIVISGSFIPRHVYDIPAAKYIELGYLNEGDPKIAGHYLENHNARSAFFQTISRVKDPEGETESLVFVYGMKKEVIEEWFLELGISTPKVLSLEEWEKHPK